MANETAAAAASAAQVDQSARVSARTRWSYGLGCIGRDATYTLVSTYLITYLTLAVEITPALLGAISVVLVIGRVWDALNDPIMGTIIDNTHTRWGKFKPFIISGAVLNSIFVILLFSGTMPVSRPAVFVAMFAISYFMWDITYTMNDIAYWGMLPSLTVNLKEREKVTSLARIGASVGLFAVTALVPLLTAGDMVKMYRVIAIGCCVLFIACQLLVIFGVQEQKNAITGAKSGARLRDIFKVVGQNDQLLAIGLTMLLFNIAYFTTTGFGMYFFYFDYGRFGGPEFTYFALTIGVTQILMLALFPQISKLMNRRKLFTAALFAVVAGYLGFMATGYLWPMNMPILIVVGFVLFAGQAVIQMLQYVLLADTVEYGQWKLGTRNETVVFSLRPLIDKMASAIQVGIMSITLVVSGLIASANKISVLENDRTLDNAQRLVMGNDVVAAVAPWSKLVMRGFMLLLPLLLILASYLVYRKLYTMDEKKYAQIITDLEVRARENPDAAQAEPAAAATATSGTNKPQE